MRVPVTMQIHQQKLAGFLVRYRIIILVLSIATLVLVIDTVMGGRRNCDSPINQKIICADLDLESNTTGLENVKRIHGVKWTSGQTSCIPFPLIELPVHLNAREKQSLRECVKSADYDDRKGHKQFWTGNVPEVRVKHHVHLNHESRILDVGGNVGEDAANFIQMFNPKVYVILEPMKYLHHKLQHKFKNNKNVTIYNIGLAKINAKYYVDMKGTEGDGTSIFHESDNNIGSCTLKTVNASEFYLKIGLGCFDFDLVTINCEGCEFDVLENMLLTGVAKYFAHIQFATHIHLAHAKNAVFRYCRIQELLSRTHKISYQYKFNWESWTRKDMT